MLEYKPWLGGRLFRAERLSNLAGWDGPGQAGAVVKHKAGLPLRLLTLREVAEYLQVHPATVYRLVKTKQLMAVRVGRDFRFDARVVEEWVAKGGSTTPSRRGRKKIACQLAYDAGPRK